MPIVAGLAHLGHRFRESVEDFGRFSQFCASTAWWFAAAPRRWLRWGLLMPQLYQMGTRSAPVIMLLGVFIGMVLSVEMFDQFRQFGQETRLGSIINMAVVRHIGPVLAAIMLAGRVGGSVSAELGTMRVTEQLDALRVMGADPVAYLVVPRVIACTFMIPLLTVFSDVMGILGGYMITVRAYGVVASDYWAHSAAFITSYDVLTGLIKSIVFGLFIGMISCYKGFNCQPGARGVGRATTDAFVTSFVAIIISNFFLAKFLKDFYGIVFGENTAAAFG